MSTIVSTTYGKLEGEGQSDLCVFKGIPFAAPPAGARRWTAPEKPASWQGVRDARAFGGVAPQNSMMNGALAAMVVDGAQSEDCLYLNVWTPRCDTARRPVMVWIHGGAFAIGSGSQPIYDGATLARRGDAVVVTINYRLAALGFLRLSDLTGGKIPASGNEGILDQIAALQWVRDNIAGFGGDPENVTIFGESAGAMSVGTILAMPAARGLFHKAIPQSGACHTGATCDAANQKAERILARLGVRPSDSDAIAALTPAQLLKGTLMPDGVTPDPQLGMAYQPVIDGAHVPKVALEMVAGGSADGVAIMAGSTLEEWKLFAAMDPGLPKLDRAGLAARFGKRFGAETAAGLIENYTRARTERGDAATPQELFSAIETDRVFRMPAVRLAETHGRRNGRIFNYLFTWKSPAMGGMLGSCHALELGFVFGTNHIAGMPPFAGSGPAAEKLAAQMQDAWIAFARTGNPACESIGDWRVYDEQRRATMVFGAATKSTDAPLDAERQAWSAVPDRILGTL
ncbi:MAG TPA: carboxylesterase/lipase family protein [Candidatus Binataceae bacterium]|nr:carboxylesterase/lipase family protein [Candidatus Binataceae bacterium]